MVKIKKAFPLGFACLLLFSLIFALLSCFSPYMGDEGTIVIMLGGNSTSRNNAPWPPDDPTQYILDDIEYEITLTGNGQTIPITAKGGDSISATVSVGWWNVNVKAFYQGALYGEGNNSVEVRSGRNNSVAIPMRQAYYLGDTGPGGGIIFYVNRAGFTVQGYGSPGDAGYFPSYTAYYLEAAPINSSTSSGPVNPQWGDSSNSISGITTFSRSPSPPYELPQEASIIGNGRKDTMTIVAHLANTIETERAAQLAIIEQGGQNDWFLPSFVEIWLLYINRTSVGNMGTAIYWTSSQDDSIPSFSFAWQFDFSQADMDYQNFNAKNQTNTVRPIRAF